MSRVPFGTAEAGLIEQIIADINNRNTRPKNLRKSLKGKTTILEHVLGLFLKRGGKGVKRPRLLNTMSAHSKASDLELATSKMLGRLKKKVAAKGGRIVSRRTKSNVLKYWISAKK